MKNTLKLIVSCILFSTLNWTVAYGAVVTFTKEYTYQASEFDSKASSRILAIEQVKRLLLEELGTYLISETEVKNFQMTKDQITVFTAGIVSAEVIDEKWDGKTYYLKAKIAADPKDVSKAVDALRHDKQKTKELEDIRRKADGQAKEIAKLKKELEVAKIGSSKLSDKVDTKTIQQYNSAVTRLSANDWFRKGIMLDSSKAAIEAYDKAIELDPEYEEAYFYRGMTYLELSINYQKVIEDITNSIKYEPKRQKDEYYSPLAVKYSIRAKAYLKLDEYEKAFNDLELAISINVYNAISTFNLKKKDYDDLIQKFPDKYQVYLFRGLFTRQIEQAMHDYENAVAMNPNSALGYYLLGRAYSFGDDQDRDTAISCFTKAQHLKPSPELLFNIYVKRSNVYFRNQNYEKSIEDISRAIEIEPEYIIGYRDRAEAYNKLGRYRAAIEDYDIAIKLKTFLIDPFDPWSITNIYVGRGDSYSALGEYTSAVKDYSVAIEILTKALHGTGVKSLSTFDYYSKRSKAYERLGKHQLAKKDFRDGVKLSFDKKDKGSSWAEFHFKMGQEFGENMEGAEDREYKEAKIECYKIAAILGHKKAQTWLKKKGIEW